MRASSQVFEILGGRLGLRSKDGVPAFGRALNSGTAPHLSNPGGEKRVALKNFFPLP